MPRKTVSRPSLPKRLSPEFCNVAGLGITVFAFGVITRLAHLNAPPSYDELYHILAAQSWLKDGTLAVYQGEYARVPLYTIFTAWMFDLAGGPDIAMARLPNVIFGALLAAGSAVWTRQVGGCFAGWVVALCVLFWPSGIQVSQTVRFYAVHGLMFFIGAVATYDLFRPGAAPMRRLAMALLAIAVLWFAKQFQDSTLVGVLGLAIWAAAFVLLPAVMKSRNRRALLLLGLVVVLVAAAAAVATGMLEEIWRTYNISPWGRDPTAYHRALVGFYPLLWTLTPALAILALRASPRPAGFCTTLVTVGLVVHSFAGVQNIRYIYYLSPFLFALWAMGLRELLPTVSTQVHRATTLFIEHFGNFGPVPPKVLSAGITGLAGLFVVLAHDAVPVSLKLMRGSVAPPFATVDDWSEARAPVTDHVAHGAVVVATHDLAAVYYLGGFDVVFSKNWMPEMNRTEFARDPRTGRPLISRVESLAALVRAYPEGIFLASQEWWSRWPASNSVGAFLRAFEGPGITSSFERAGPVWILHWKSDDHLRTSRQDAIREIVDRQRWASDP